MNSNTPAASGSEVLGKAKQLNKDVESLPLEEHGAIISILAQLYQYRVQSFNAKAQAEQRAKEEEHERQLAAQQEFLSKRREGLAVAGNVL